LEELSQYYELIAFTGSTPENANIILDAIEEGKFIFAQRLYRNHMIIIDNEFVKDLNRIGRPLDKIIIVDNRPQNFRLQKENGICIKSFFGEDKSDMNLINLKNILIDIAQEGGDLRFGIQKYKNKILEKVESNLYKNNI
jgi:TFIIF-interacting CTD phosphatase-like protein